MTTPETPQGPQLSSVIRPDMPSIYVEGLSQLMIGFPNSRMHLHSFVEREVIDQTTTEKRHIACELIMPTSAMIEIAQLLINSLVANKAVLEASRAEWIGKLEAITNSLKPIDSPVMQPAPTQS